jgi:hypothetical protein
LGLLEARSRFRPRYSAPCFGQFRDYCVHIACHASFRKTRESKLDSPMLGVTHMVVHDILGRTLVPNPVVLHESILIQLQCCLGNMSKISFPARIAPRFADAACAWAELTSFGNPAVKAVLLQLNVHDTIVTFAASRSSTAEPYVLDSVQCSTQHVAFCKSPSHAGDTQLFRWIC